MKAITICQPYATLIIDGAKRVENRTWYCAYRGPIAIHASKSKEWLVVRPSRPDYDDMYAYKIADLPFGAVIGTANLVACIRKADIALPTLPKNLEWLRGHDHAYGPWCFVLDDIKAIEKPVACAGQQGIWEWNSEGATSDTRSII